MSIILFLNNQPDALNIQIYSVIKLYMFRASSVPIIRSSLLYIRHWQVSCRFLMTASKQSQKTLNVSGIFFTHHQEFSTVHSALVSFMQVFDDCFQAEPKNSTCFGHLLCPSSGVFHCTFGTGKFHAGFWWLFPSRVKKLYVFRASSLPIIRSFPLYIWHW